MSLTFTNAMSSITAGTPSTIYTVPNGKSATIFGLTVANTSAAVGSVNIKVGTVGSTKYLLLGGQIKVGGTLIAVGGSQKIVLTQNQIIEVTVNNSSTGTVTADVIASIMLQ